MTDNPDVKKKLLKQINEINAMLLEHGVKGKLSDCGPDMIEFTVVANKSLTSLVKALYMRQGVERVLIQSGRAGRGTHFIQICLSSWN
jgi:hypothetical protein